ncbi:MAG: GAF domain-containing protein [Anaerolineae bacterium]|nr:GAF domain-containing protein [Anaerolineae bacterium]
MRDGETLAHARPPQTMRSSGRPPRGEPWQEHVARQAVPLAALLSLPLVAQTCYDAYLFGLLWAIPATLVAYAVLAVAALWTGLPYAVRVGAPAFTLLVAAVVQSVGLGRAGEGAVLFLAGAVLLALLFGARVGVGVLAAGAVVVGVAASLTKAPAEMTGSARWIGSTVALATGGGVVASVAAQLAQQVARAPRRMEEPGPRGAPDEGALARRVAELEEASVRLEGRAEALGALTGIAGPDAAELGLDELLRRAAILISQRFGFYHVGIFLVDVAGSWAVLEAASSEGGGRMLARQHRLRVGEEGVVGHVAASGEPRVVFDVRQDALYYQNPDLPETRSEIAVPLLYEKRVLGVLDVQDTALGAFRPGDVLLMQTLAELVVVAIRNARMFAELRQAIVAERRSYAEMSEQAWRERMRHAGPIEYRYEDGEVSRVGDLDIGPDEGGEPATALPELSLPVSVRGRVIGALRAHKPADAGQWSLGEREAMETLVTQLDAALESARLYEDTQELAARERVLAHITARMRETLDVQTILYTAADEVYRALGLEEVVIRLVDSGQIGEPADGR